MKIRMILYHDGKRKFSNEYDLPPMDDGMDGYVKDVWKYKHEKFQEEINRLMSLQKLHAGLNEADLCVFELTIQSKMNQ